MRTFLTQEHTTNVDGKTVTHQHPITYISGLLQGSQYNGATLTKEEYAIYVTVKKLSLYLTDANITLQSDHLTLKLFLQKAILNTKVVIMPKKAQPGKASQKCLCIDYHTFWLITTSYKSSFKGFRCYLFSTFTTDWWIVCNIKWFNCLFFIRLYFRISSYCSFFRSTEEIHFTFKF